MAHDTTDSNFENDVIKEKGFVLVDFWAEWCGPCRQLMPHVQELSEKMADKVKVMKVNIDQNPETPTKYGVRGIPTLILFKDGKQVATKVGSMPKTSLFEWVENTTQAA